MFDSIKFKFNKMKVNNKLKRFKDVEISRYNVECKMIDGSTVHFGSNYKATTFDYDTWIKLMMYEKTIKTNENTYINSKNIVEVKLDSCSKETIKYCYDYFYDNEQYKRYYADEEIQFSKKLYGKLICLNKTK